MKRFYAFINYFYTIKDFSCKSADNKKKQLNMNDAPYCSRALRGERHVRRI